MYTITVGKTHDYAHYLIINEFAPITPSKFMLLCEKWDICRITNKNENEIIKITKKNKGWIYKNKLHFKTPKDVLDFAEKIIQPHLIARTLINRTVYQELMRIS